MNLWRFARPVLDTNWLICHAILPTKDRLIQFGMRGIISDCYCTQLESHVHLFVQCPLSVYLIAWFLKLYQKFDPNKYFLRGINYFFGFSQEKEIPIAFSALLGIIRHRIWVMRNAAVFDKIPPDKKVALIKVKANFRFLLSLEKKKHPCETFEKSWLAGGIFGTLKFPDGIDYCQELL